MKAAARTRIDRQVPLHHVQIPPVPARVFAVMWSECGLRPNSDLWKTDRSRTKTARDLVIHLSRVGEI